MDRKYNNRVRTDVKNRERKSEVEESIIPILAAATTRVVVSRLDITYHSGFVMIMMMMILIKRSRR